MARSMANKGGRRQSLDRLRASLSCFQCNGLLTKNTQSLSDCGHSFCAVCLRDHMQDNNSCPECRALAQPKDLRKNPLVEQLATSYVSAFGNAAVAAVSMPATQQLQRSQRPSPPPPQQQQQPAKRHKRDRKAQLKGDAGGDGAAAAPAAANGERRRQQQRQRQEVEEVYPVDEDIDEEEEEDSPGQHATTKGTSWLETRQPTSAAAGGARSSSKKGKASASMSRSGATAQKQPTMYAAMAAGGGGSSSGRKRAHGGGSRATQHAAAAAAAAVERRPALSDFSDDADDWEDDPFAIGGGGGSRSADGVTGVPGRAHAAGNAVKEIFVVKKSSAARAGGDRAGGGAGASGDGDGSLQQHKRQQQNPAGTVPDVQDLTGDGVDGSSTARDHRASRHSSGGDSGVVYLGTTHSQGSSSAAGHSQPGRGGHASASGPTFASGFTYSAVGDRKRAPRRGSGSDGDGSGAASNDDDDFFADSQGSDGDGGGPVDYTEAIEAERALSDHLLAAGYLRASDLAGSAHSLTSLNKVLFDLLWDGVLAQGAVATERELARRGCPVALIEGFVDSRGLRAKNRHLTRHLEDMRRTYRAWEPRTR